MNLTELHARLTEHGSHTAPVMEMPSAVRRLVPFEADEIMVLECEAEAAWLDAPGWTVIDGVMVHDLPVVVMWR